MRILYLAPIILLLTSCNPAEKKSGSTTTGAINRDAPYLWTDYPSAKTLRISTDFNDDEVANIVAMSSAWETSLENKKSLFAYGDRTSEITNNINDLDSMNDGVMGVYKTSQWPLSFPSSALAVTQIFAIRRNIGTPSEFVDIVHADILINEEHHNFRTDGLGTGYDLQTVLLHEMGHFMGLQHKSTTTDRNNSVMYPSINSTEEKRTPRAIDAGDLANKYSINLDDGGGAGHAVMMDKPKVKYEIDPNDVGEPVKIIIELHADGECVHKIDGALVGRHRNEK